MPATSKIEQYGLSKKALELKGEGKSNAEIARELSTPGRVITEMSLHRFFEKHREETSEAMSLAVARNAELAEKQVEAHLDAVAQLSVINTETLAILRAAKASADFNVALRAIARVEAQLQLQAQLLGEIQQPQTVIFNISRAASSGRGEEAREEWQ
jgi:6-phosphogluconate dehydrogenase